MDGDHTAAVDREAVEHIVAAALGRQLKFTVLLALMLGVAGFVLGGFLVDAQLRQSMESLKRETAGLQSQLVRLVDRSAEQEQQHAQLALVVNDIETLRREEAERNRETLETLAAIITNRRNDWINDLGAYTEGRVHVPPQAAADAINRYVDEQMTVLNQVLGMTANRVAQQRASRTRIMEAADHAPSHGGPAARTAPEPVQATTEADASEDGRSAYFTPPRRKGYLFFSPSQPRPIKAVHVNEPSLIPLPPR